MGTSGAACELWRKQCVHCCMHANWRAGVEKVVRPLLHASTALGGLLGEETLSGPLGAAGPHGGKGGGTRGGLRAGGTRWGAAGSRDGPRGHEGR
jgi:hypothetical protein